MSENPLSENPSSAREGGDRGAAGDAASAPRPQHPPVGPGELLALVEDQLDPGEAERLRARIVDDPEIAGLVADLEADRRLLRELRPPKTGAGGDVGPAVGGSAVDAAMAVLERQHLLGHPEAVTPSAGEPAAPPAGLPEASGRFANWGWARYAAAAVLLTSALGIVVMVWQSTSGVGDGLQAQAGRLGDNPLVDETQSEGVSGVDSVMPGPPATAAESAGLEALASRGAAAGFAEDADQIARPRPLDDVDLESKSRSIADRSPRLPSTPMGGVEVPQATDLAAVLGDLDRRAGEASGSASTLLDTLHGEASQGLPLPLVTELAEADPASADPPLNERPPAPATPEAFNVAAAPAGRLEARTQAPAAASATDPPTGVAVPAAALGETLEGLMQSDPAPQVAVTVSEDPATRRPLGLTITLRLPDADGEAPLPNAVSPVTGDAAELVADPRPLRFEAEQPRGVADADISVAERERGESPVASAATLENTAAATARPATPAVLTVRSVAPRLSRRRLESAASDLGVELRFETTGASGREGRASSEAYSLRGAAASVSAAQAEDLRAVLNRSGGLHAAELALPEGLEPEQTFPLEVRVQRP